MIRIVDVWVELDLSFFGLFVYSLVRGLSTLIMINGAHVTSQTKYKFSSSCYPAATTNLSCRAYWSVSRLPQDRQTSRIFRPL